MKKPIKVFYSELSGRFYASQRYKVWPSGLVEITGEKFDVTNDIGVVIEKYALEFTVRKKWQPKVGDWVLYKHESGQEIMGIVRQKKGTVYTIKDWLTDEVVEQRQVLEVRPPTKEGA